ncbi:MAG: hypothetical protein ACXAAI_08520, partial [Promethearchaeota archaeon]
MKDLQINDNWILNRVSSQSTSFSSWLKNLLKEVEGSIEDLPEEERDNLKKKKDFSSLKNLTKVDEILSDKGLTGKMSSGFGQKILNSVIPPLKAGLQESFQELFASFDIDYITGKRKNLASTLYDVSKERGIKSSGLLYLIKALPDLEAFLYSTSVKKYYRDHTEHALRVAVLGDFLLEQDLGQGSMDGIISELTNIDKKVLKEELWWIVGLVHDIGYPLGKMTTAVNYSLINQLLKCYPSLDLEFAPFEINLAWKGYQEDYLKIIEEDLSKEAKKLIRMGAGFYNQGIPKQDLQTFLNKQDGHPEYQYNSSINLDHGVISALSLLKSLGTPDEIRVNDKYHGYIKVAQAISLHNFKDTLEDYLFERQPLAFFLMLIDELQEWGRPIPIKIRDTYFTTELKKVSLLDELLLNLDEFTWYMQFKNKDAKELMGFDFKRFSNEKKKTFGRLKSGNLFPQT